MCWSYNRQYGTQFLAAMPTNLYGIGDNYHLENSHVIPALIRKFHEAKENHQHNVTVWGTGTPRREFLFSDDMAEACLFILSLPDEEFKSLLASDRNDGLPPLMNLGSGKDISVAELANLVKVVVGFEGEIIFDTSKPNGTLQKLMNVGLLKKLGWQYSVDLREGLALAYGDFKESIKVVNQAAIKVKYETGQL